MCKTIDELLDKHPELIYQYYLAGEDFEELYQYLLDDKDDQGLIWNGDY